MIFNKWLVIGEDCIIANFLIYFKNLVNFYIAWNRLELCVSLPSRGCNFYRNYIKAALTRLVYDNKSGASNAQKLGRGKGKEKIEKAPNLTNVENHAQDKNMNQLIAVEWENIPCIIWPQANQMAPSDRHSHPILP